MKRCMYCGQENEDSAETCVKCGNPLLDVPENNSEPIEEIPDIDLEEPASADVNKESTGQAETESAGTNADTASGQPDGSQNTESEGGQEKAEPAEEPEKEEAAANDQSGEAPADGQEPYYGPADSGEPYYGQADGQQPYYGQTGGQQPYYGPDGGQPYRGYNQEVSYDQQPGYDEEEPDEEVSVIGQTFPVILRKSRKRVRSFLFFLAALFYTVMTVASVANIVIYMLDSFGGRTLDGGFIVSLETAVNTIVRMIGTTQASDIQNYLFSFLDGANPLMVLAVQALLVLPMVFIMIGLWSAFASTKVREKEVRTGGYTLIQAMEIIRFAAACLVLVAAITVTVSYVVVAARQSTMTTLIVGIIVLLVVVLFAVMTIMFYVQLLFSIKLIKRNVRTGEYLGKIPGYLITIGFILCLLSAAATVFLTAADDYTGLAFGGARAVWYLLISVWGLVYRATVKINMDEE